MTELGHDSSNNWSSPRGAPLTALSWGRPYQTRVAEAGDFLLQTPTRMGGRHVVPVLGVWPEGPICFVTSGRPR